MFCRTLDDGVGQRLVVGREADAVDVQARGQSFGRAARLPRGCDPDPVDVAAPSTVRDEEEMGAVAPEHGAVIEVTLVGESNRLPAFHRYRPQRGGSGVENRIRPQQIVPIALRIGQSVAAPRPGEALPLDNALDEEAARLSTPNRNDEETFGWRPTPVGDPFAVGRPRGLQSLIGDPPRCAAQSRHDIDLLPILHLSGERDLRPIGRPAGAVVGPREVHGEGHRPAARDLLDVDLGLPDGTLGIGHELPVRGEAGVRLEAGIPGELERAHDPGSRGSGRAP